MSLLAFSSDHAGFQLKRQLLEYARELGHDTFDCGTHDENPVDYPDFITPVCRAVREQEAVCGVLICGSGIGMCIGANRFQQIRAALCITTEMAKLARRHNNSNVLCLGSRLISDDENLAILKTFLETDFDAGRHTPRILKLESLGGPSSL